MEINVGEYIRYGQKGILYFKDYIKDNYGKRAYLCSVCEREILINKKYIDNFSKYKHSKDIIDLIEVGDYVNGCYVTNRSACHNDGIILIPKRIGIIKCNAYFNQGSYSDCSFQWIENEDIKSVLTKQQFEANAYTIEKER